MAQAMSAMFGRRNLAGAPPPANNPVDDNIRLDADDPAKAAAPSEPAPPAAAPAAAAAQEDAVAAFVGRILPLIRKELPLGEALRMSRGNLAGRVAAAIDDCCRSDGSGISDADRRRVVTATLNALLAEARRHVQGEPASDQPAKPASAGSTVVETTKLRIQPILLERIDISKAVTLPPEELAKQISEIVGEILGEEKIQLNGAEQRDLVTTLLNDMLGLGPLEVLLGDEAVTDIMVNGPKQVYVERKGKLELTHIQFRDDAHVMGICTRIVTRVGRRVDETTPLCDARLQDGSRVNIIIPPLAIDGPSISIRKFAKQKITLDIMERNGNLSPQMATVLRIASRARLNIIVSGGTGSGKTTLLNALSRMIDDGERIVTIEDAAELQMQQPHVVRLETRPPNLEGQGEITQRELVKNALRMRPDRIILGEIRAGEALDMLQAMNTGHDGSMGTIHANRPREALTRLENMVAMTGVKLPNEAVRAQIAGAVNMIVQIARMRDGVRRITHITEVVGMEGDVITTQDLFTFEFRGEDKDGRLTGAFKCSGLRPFFTARAEYFGLHRALLEAVASQAEVIR
jgi:pilus assembly protein CpaF